MNHVSMLQPSHIKVSVIVLTYNQANYVDEALKSVLCQNTNFNFEVVIGDDCSSDNTLQHLKLWQSKFPDKVRILTSDNNQGLLPNFIRTFNNCRGEYIAICEGDDYWIDKNKLQIQVDFLDSNPSYSTCIHRVINYYEDDNSKSLSNGGQKAHNTILDLAKMNFISNVAAVFRASRVNNLPDWFINVGTYDYALHMLNAANGDIFYINRAMAVYRKHLGAIWSRNGKDKQLLLSMQVREYILNHYRLTRPDVFNIMFKSYLACAVALINFYRDEDRNNETPQVFSRIKSFNPDISDAEINDLCSKAHNAKPTSKQQIMQIAKNARRLVSKLIPIPKP